METTNKISAGLLFLNSSHQMAFYKLQLPKAFKKMLFSDSATAVGNIHQTKYI